MPISSPRLRRLDNALASLRPESDAMLLSELDGYLAAVILCPEPILPVEWLPPVWGGDGDIALFVDERDAQWLTQQIMAHYHAVVRTLDRARARYAPFLETDVRHGEVLWELWIEGFDVAMELRPDSWAAFADSDDEDVVAAFAAMVTLVEIACDESSLERDVIDALTREAPELIPALVERLYAWRRDHIAPPAIADAPRPKAGRNDPCPCGSGSKFKKCCGKD